MSDVLANQGADEGTVRKLWPTETEKFRDHLLRLDKDSRRMRFAHSVSDSFIDDYAGRMAEFGSVVYGYVAEGRVRAAAELHSRPILSRASLRPSAWPTRCRCSQA